jgi:hypothetical protein
MLAKLMRSFTCSREYHAEGTFCDRFLLSIEGPAIPHTQVFIPLDLSVTTMRISYKFQNAPTNPFCGKSAS